ncbi:cytochrome P450 [Fomitopsis serialis]|uniref:cytochrome P450 n=1 Tax=Fomitopsis serialis TaxID=139415 RepID=UPI002007BB37|nr:cytochrome P450 [Neoantrodia serialis]KAH9919404.1 cytochrome P450 [Neoantrodia serialis]
MADALEIASAVLAVFVLTVFINWRFHPLYSIPAIGRAYKYCNNAREVLQEGYAKHKVFKVAMLDQWIVIVSGADMNEELRKIRTRMRLLIRRLKMYIVQMRYTLSESVVSHPIHLPAIRGPLTRNLGILFGDVVDEVNAAFADTIGNKLQSDGELTIPVVLSRMGQCKRADDHGGGYLAGRNEDYLQIVRQFTFDVGKARFLLSLFPKSTRNASVYLKPMIEERQKKLKVLGDDWTDKPNDYLMWMIDEANREGQPTQVILEGIMVSNFAAIHTSSNSMTHAIYHLAGAPEYAAVLREEVENVIKEDGWTKVAFGKMWKLDSFMRESQRINGITHISVMRKILQDTTLSDGTFLPAGTVVAGAASATHRDARSYENPDVFDPFRFSDMRNEDDARIKHQFVSTSPEYVAFGGGKHACPGRFFAVNELKVMMVYTLLHYDVKFEDGQPRPDNSSRWHDVLFRKRQVVAA